MNTIRLGIIGPGNVWEKVHKPVLKRLKNKFKIAAFCATSEKSKNKISGEYPNLPFYEDYRILVKQSFIDAVLILTPIIMNATVAIEALKSRKDVFMEKPMATNTAEGLKLIKKEKEYGKKIFILEQNVYTDNSEKFLNIINSGLLGDILMYERLDHSYIGYQEHRDNEYGNIEWRINPKFPLGMLFDSGIHFIAFLSKVFGKPSAVFASGNNYRKEYGEFDNILSVFEYKNKLIGSYNHSCFLNGNINYFIIRGTKGFAFSNDSKIILEIKNGKKEIIKTDDKNLHYKIWSLFAECMATNKKPYYTTDIAMNDLIILEAIEKSIKTARKINI